MEFITNMVEFRAAQEQVTEYIISGRRDDDERMERLVTEMEMFTLRIDSEYTRTLH